MFRIAKHGVFVTVQSLLSEGSTLAIGTRIACGSVCLLLGHVTIRLLWKIWNYRMRRASFDHIPWIWNGTNICNVPKLYAALPWIMQIGKSGTLLEYFDRFRDVKTGKIIPVVYSGCSFAFEPQVSISDSRCFGEILNDLTRFPKYRGFYVLYEPILGRGLLTSIGDAHRTQRKTLTTLFHFGSLRSSMQIMEENAISFVDEEIKAGGFLIHQDTFKKFTLSVITRYTFSAAFDRNWMRNTWDKILKYFVIQNTLRVFIGDFIRYLPSPSSVYLIILRRKISSYIVDRRKMLQISEDRAGQSQEQTYNANHSSARKCSTMYSDLGMTFVDHLILAGCPTHLIVDECTTFLFAAHDTTSSLLAWTAHELSKAPEHQRLIREELARVLGPGPVRTVPFEDVQRLEYLTAVLKEVLRLWPPVSHVQRLNAQPGLVVAGTPVPAGAVLELVFHAAHRDPAVWPDPSAFRPERWLLPGDSDEARRRHPYAYVPFLAGPRGCVGRRFALQQAAVAAAMLLSRYELAEAFPGAAARVVPAVVAVVEPQNLAVRCVPLCAGGKGAGECPRAQASPSESQAVDMDRDIEPEGVNVS